MRSCHALACATALLTSAGLTGQTSAAQPVTVDNFIRAESDLYMGNMVKDGSVGKFFHRREPAAIDNQTVIRLNRDTLYSAGRVRPRCGTGDDHATRCGQALHVLAGDQ